MDPALFELVVRDVAYYAVLGSGVFFVAGSCAALAGWALKKWLETVGMYAEFLSFVRGRRRRR